MMFIIKLQIAYLRGDFNMELNEHKVARNVAKNEVLKMIDDFRSGNPKLQDCEWEEGAEWFIYDGLSQINRGGTEIEENDKTYTIKSLKDYYDYLISLKS